MNRVLLHDCCAPCGAYVVEELKSRGFEVLVYFYNPNIAPREEYDLRLEEMKKYCQKNKVKMMVGNYEHDDWLEMIKGEEKAPERGRRCELCFMKRLSEAAQKAQEENCQYFATTLTISPHKDSEKINKIGHEIAPIYGLNFIDEDWKKNDGYKKACDLSRAEGFRRQSYCGCEFSFRNKIKE